MTFRDDREANRARIEALEEKLAEAKAEAEAHRRDAEAARDEARRARAGEKERPAKPPKATGGKLASTGLIALFVGVPAIAIGYGLLAPYRSYGWPIPKAPTVEQRLPGCSCKLADGRSVELGMKVDSAEAIQSPGNPWKMILSWRAHGVGDPLPLDEPYSYETAPSRYVQEQLMYGYVIDVGVACVGDDLLVVTSQADVSAWSLSERRLVHKERVVPPQITFLSDRRVELRCHALETHGDTVRIPVKRGSIEKRFGAGAKP